MQAKLIQLGFDVELVLDQDRLDMARAVQRFVRRLQAPERASIGLFYYAGHALQVDAENYLMPVDAKLLNEMDVKPETLELKWVVNVLQRNAKTGLIFLDACRNNPLADRLPGPSRSAERGLSALHVSGGDLMLAYATTDGMIADDGTGAHSPFTDALLEHIATPGVVLQLVMSRVTSSVLAHTKGRQRPWMSTSLQSEIYLAGTAGQPSVTVAAAPPRPMKSQPAFGEANSTLMVYPFQGGRVTVEGRGISWKPREHVLARGSTLEAWRYELPAGAYRITCRTDKGMFNAQKLLSTRAGQVDSYMCP